MFKGYDLNNLKTGCIAEAAKLSRQAAAEGIVLIKNDGVLPFDRSKNVSIFGRAQTEYIKSGLGSGGRVNTEYCVNIVDGLRGRININEDLAAAYEKFIEENPPVTTDIWDEVLWSQKEMQISDELCMQAAKQSDCAIFVIGRTAGESRDNQAVKGSYLLSEDEESNLKTVLRHFEKVCVVLNIGNIMDMKWVEEYGVPCVLYAWQGGQEGGNALADVILGDVSPSGRLTDTIAYDINDYPSFKNHGDPVKNIYAEDIYVGYRYFETFAKESVMYPFGYGLSYTNFSYQNSAEIINDRIKVTSVVKNIGGFSGKAVVQVYFSAPQGKLGKPSRELVGYAKTHTLNVGESETAFVDLSLNDMAAYDDIDTFSYILEEGEYVIYVGENVRDAKKVLTLKTEERTIKKLRQALAPIEEFKRLKPNYENGHFDAVYIAAATRKYDIKERMKEHIIPQQPPTGKKNISLRDVKNGKNTLNEFIMQLSCEDMTCLVKGEGMNSQRVRAGSASAFGGVTDELLAYGVPTVCTCDGPSGIRMDNGDKATLIPNGTCLASTWNNNLVEEIYEYVGIELRANEVDVLLGPGVNIHRCPLNGRNFEYFSEDSFISGKIAASCVKGLSGAGVFGTLKHFACNSQELARNMVNSVVSERALREIYLRPFEIAVKEGNAKSIMTSYNKINGSYSPTNYDLCTSILRDEWGYDGIVMTDWWPHLDAEEEKNTTNLSAMVQAQNDMYMVVNYAKNNADNLTECVKNGKLDVYYLRKCAENILSFILNTPAIYRKGNTVVGMDRDNFEFDASIRNVCSGTHYNAENVCAIEVEYKTFGSELNQYFIRVFKNGKFFRHLFLKGSGENAAKAFVFMGENTKNVMLKYKDSFEYININILKKR